jgi:hypothetical protein
MFGCGAYMAWEAKVEDIHQKEQELKAKTHNKVCIAYRTLECLNDTLLDGSPDICSLATGITNQCKALAESDCALAGCGDPDKLNSCSEYIFKIKVDGSSQN